MNEKVPVKEVFMQLIVVIVHVVNTNYFLHLPEPQVPCMHFTQSLTIQVYESLCRLNNYMSAQCKLSFTPQTKVVRKKQENNN